MSFDGPVSVRFEAHEAGSGEIVVRGRVKGTLLGECRRCLEPIRRGINLNVTLVFVPSDELRDDEGESDVLVVTPDVVDLNLGEAVREELILNAPRYGECRPDCKGLCPICGVNLNETTCDCSLDEPDPRWDALRALKNE